MPLIPQNPATSSSPVIGVLTCSGAPTNGTSGTFAGIAVKGALMTDITNAVLYINTNTQASPTWSAFTNP